MLEKIHQAPHDTVLLGKQANLDPKLGTGAPAVCALPFRSTLFFPSFVSRPSIHNLLQILQFQLLFHH